MRLLVLAIFAFGFTFRLWTAASTYNPDAATLTWGSAFVAQGYGDPYKAVVRYSATDPIPLSRLRSLSLAQGYVGVVAGAVPLWVGEHLGLLHLDDPPDGRRLGIGELFAYKLSYLPADVLILFCLHRLFRRDRRKRLLAYVIWAANPLSFFAYGQGFPDLWTAAFLLAGFLLVTYAGRDAPPDRKWRAYVLAGGVVALGTFGTKLLPLLLLVALGRLLFGDGALDRRRKATAALAVAGSCAVCALPYLFSAFARLNVFQRFEFNARSTLEIPVAADTVAAELGLVIMIVVTLWFLLSADPLERLEAWFVITYLTVAVFLGLLNHLLIWAFAPTLVVVNRNERAAVLLTVAEGLRVFWSVFYFDWLTAVMLRGVHRSAEYGNSIEWVRRAVPFEAIFSGLMASLLVVAVGYAMVSYVRGWRDEVGARRAVAWSLAGLAALTPVALVLESVMAADVGPLRYSTEADFTRRAEKRGDDLQDATLEFPRFSNWESDPVRGHHEVNYLLLKTHSDTEPSLDDVVARVVRNGRVLARGRIPIWVADPQSDRGPVKIPLSRTVDLEGARIVLERLPPGWDASVESPPQERVNRPRFRLPAVVVAGTKSGVPLIEMRESLTGDATGRLLRAVFSWQRLLAVPLLGCLVALLAAWLVERDSFAGTRLRIRLSVSRE